MHWSCPRSSRTPQFEYSDYENEPTADVAEDIVWDSPCPGSSCDPQTSIGWWHAPSYLHLWSQVWQSQWISFIRLCFGVLNFVSVIFESIHIDHRNFICFIPKAQNQSLLENFWSLTSTAWENPHFHPWTESSNLGLQWFLYLSFESEKSHPQSLHICSTLKGTYFSPVSSFENFYSQFHESFLSSFCQVIEASTWHVFSL